MAATIVITCPKCKKQMKGSAELIGKRIRCKGCGQAIPVRAPGKAIAGKKKGGKGRDPDDLDDDGNPYGITDLEVGYRCPNCANEMEHEGAVICLVCGYNTTTRLLPKVERTYANSAGDYIKWLAAPAFCAFLTLVLVGVIIFIFTGAKAILEDNKEEWWAFSVELVRLWGTVFCLFCIFFLGKFAFKRFVFHFHPPEKVKGK